MIELESEVKLSCLDDSLTMSCFQLWVWQTLHFNSLFYIGLHVAKLQKPYGKPVSYFACSLSESQSECSFSFCLRLHHVMVTTMVY